MNENISEGEALMPIALCARQREKLQRATSAELVMLN
jgi:hypothetical protein